MNARLGYRQLGRDDAGMGTLQSVMILAVSAMVLLGMRMFWDPNYSGPGGIFAALEHKFDVIFNGGEDLAGDPSVPDDDSESDGSDGDGTGDTDSTDDDRNVPDDDLRRRNALIERLEALNAEYERLVASCEVSQSGHFGQSCVLQHQILQLVNQTLDRMRSDSGFYPEWITGVLEQSHPTIDRNSTPRAWQDRFIATILDMLGQGLDAAVTPFHALMYLWDGDSFDDAVRNAMNNSIHNFGDVEALPAGLLHFAKDLDPGFRDQAADLIDREIASGATEAQIRQVIANIDSEHEWLLSTAVPNGFRQLAHDGHVGRLPSEIAQWSVPPLARWLRQMWSNVLGRRGLGHLNPT